MSDYLVVSEYSKSQYPPIFKINQSMKKVYGAIHKSNGQQVYLPKLGLNPKYTKFYVKLSKLLNVPFKTYKEDANFQYISTYAFQNPNGYNNFKTEYYTEHMVIFDNGKVELALSPWNDGVFVVGIKVYQQFRGSGIGTEWMKKIMEVGKQLNCLIYLNPYPSHLAELNLSPDEYTKDDEYNNVIRLINWYEGLGFKECKQFPNCWKK
jgi:GNAT superfamily N-acetyltransferase